MRTRTLVIAAVAVSVLGACRPRPPQAPPAPEPPPPAIAPEASGPQALRPAETDPGMIAATAGASAGAAVSPATVLAKKQPPPLQSMQRARAGSKLGVAVDLLYQFDGEIEAERPVTLHLAAVPRVEGSNLTVSVQPAEGIDAMAAPLAAQKASVSQAYRQQLSLTRHAGAPEELRVLVTMDVPEGSAFGYYSVPLTGSDATR